MQLFKKYMSVKVRQECETKAVEGIFAIPA